MTREEFDNLKVGDKIIHAFGGIGIVTEKEENGYTVKDKGLDCGDGLDEVSFAWNEGELMKQGMRVLDLVLKHQWYDMIESGEKREEYREIKPYWSKRLVGVDKPLFSHRYGYQHANVKGYTHVRFRYGYTKRTMLYKIDEITIGRGNPNWGAPTDRDVFIISLGERCQ